MSKHILIVDDSRLSRMLIKGNMQESHPDWTFTEAGDAASALQALQGIQPDLITIDYNMPQTDGLTLAQQLLEQGCTARMVLLTANIQDSIRQKADSIGVSFVRKPITPQCIAEVMAILG